jgi:hypothetical protein
MRNYISLFNERHTRGMLLRCSLRSHKMRHGFAVIFHINFMLIQRLYVILNAFNPVSCRSDMRKR